MSTTVPPLDIANVQGDILAGLPKKVQHYLLFQIDDDVQAFRQRLKLLIPLITTTPQVQDDRAKIAAAKKAATEQGKPAPLVKLSGINISFSHSGLVKLGITDDLGDAAFAKGQFADSATLADPGSTDANGNFVPNWIPAFKNPIHGVVLVSGDSELTVTATQAIVNGIFNIGAHNATMHEVLTIKGQVRPKDEKGHEHFGFLDGISQPAVKDFDTKPNPGQETVRQGVILCGRENDIVAGSNPPVPVVRPAWALDGSFLALRYLFQLVPEFNTFLKDNAIKASGLTPEQGSELLGARLVGRWKSGAPIDLFPLQDNPTAGVDAQQNNNFRYDFPDDPHTQDRCPFAAHTRKTNPRADLEDLGISTENRRIIRRGVQFGPEVTPDEAKSGKTKLGRGLIFAAYQSNIVNGFQFIQQSWANNTGFPIQKNPIVPGFDPIIGQQSNLAPRTLSGTDPNNQGANLSLPTEWVVPKGGEYFFAPSIPALKSKFSL
ncbi:Dyp-type peroxidase [Lentinus brumalis]|uniref:Dyp-type peroxidase n=1 Tax=Lentinus brumalis TaxID=2498619 RepID=A0A371CUR5_9APHY|nr:Dyp-type peroxidase [Polyporus brumalis]